MGIELIRRSEFIDFIRGIVIIDMMLVHYKERLNIIAGVNLSKLIGYTDFAIEGFIFLAGFMVGYYYFKKFKEDKLKVVKRFLRRAANILKIHYIMILTISLPLAFLFGDRATGGESTSTYIFRSLVFLNQVGLLHILPTFIPLFLISIPILYALDRGCDFTVLLVSIGIFTFGNIDPYILDIGDKTIFPVILWQIYFVMGVLLGKKTCTTGFRVPGSRFTHLIIAASLLLVMSFVYFGHHLHPYIGHLKESYDLKVSKFPLNFLGLFYRGSLLYLVFGISIAAWQYIMRAQKTFSLIELLGRHSLLTFVIHIYFAKAVLVAEYLVGDLFPFPQIIITLNICFTFVALQYIEVLQRQHDFAKRSYLSRIYRLVS